LEFKDYYAVLGVEKNADADAVKKAFRKLARKYHPDVSKEPDAEERMKQLNEAFAVLSDPEKRAAYDQVGQGNMDGGEFHPPPGWDGGQGFARGHYSDAEAADFSDFFSDLFGRARAGGSAGGNFNHRGEDQHAKIELELEDSYHGGVRNIALRVPEQDAQGRLRMQQRQLEVKIPKGIRERQMIRLAGQGGPGLGQGAAGDLLLEVHFKHTPARWTEEKDVYLKLPITPWEAALGAEVVAQVPDGSVQVRIPPASQPGRKLRLKGRGLPAQQPGDLYLVLEILVPPAATARQRELYEEMAREFPFNPRQS
jgi:curved DNA-binding protein